MSAQLLIVGLGNPLMADDGAGHAVVGRLGHSEQPPGLRLLLIDGDVLGLGQLWTGEAAIWLVDAVIGTSPAGTLHIFEHEDLLRLPAAGQSSHQPSVSESLRWLLHAHPELAEVRFRLYGVEVDGVRPEEGLSPAVEAAADRLAGVIRAAAADFLAGSGSGEAGPRTGGGEATSS